LNPADEYKKLKFCPTYMTTGQVFRSLMFGQNTLLVTGHYGIGKTYSFVLYRLLSDIIFRYKHNYTKDPVKPESESEIDFELPKVVYWSTNFDYP
jgi:hypothetical protein